MARILVVEDDPDIAELIVHYLQNAGHTTASALVGRGGDARSCAATPVDLVILDVMLPGLDGMAVCEAMRARYSDVTSADHHADGARRRSGPGRRPRARRRRLRHQAVQPEGARRARRRAAPPAARAADRAPTPSVLRYGPITIDPRRHRVTLDGDEVRLTAKEFLLLQYLVRHRGRVLSRDLLLTDVWGYQYTGGTRTVDVHIRRLREKLPVLNDAIETVKQFGYKLV